MEKERQIKILSIIALVFAIVGMSLGFAAFSVSLKIESSATVTPNASDFKLVIYGWGDESCSADNYWDCLNDNSKAIAVEYSGDFNTAVIDNITGNISNIRVSYQGFDSISTIYEGFYILKLQNEGKYDIYLNQNDLIDLGSNSVERTCTPIGDTSKELVDAACDNISMYAQLYQIVNDKEETATSLKIAPGDFLITKLFFDYNNKNSQPDGPFEIKFNDIKINYSTSEN